MYTVIIRVLYIPVSVYNPVGTSSYRSEVLAETQVKHSRINYTMRVYVYILCTIDECRHINRTLRWRRKRICQATISGIDTRSILAPPLVVQVQSNIRVRIPVLV